MVPFVQRKIQEELRKVLGDVEQKLLHVEVQSKIKATQKLPQQSSSAEEVKAILQQHKALENVDWKNGRVSGTVYHGGAELSKLIVDTFSMFSHSNPLHPDVFPSTRLMESEVVSMVLNMFNARIGGDNGACGNVTSGGTESIMMSVKAHRDWARSTKGITQPEMLIPITAHAAFDKAGAYFGVKVIHVDINTGSDWRVNLQYVRRLINGNTIMLVGSAPNYPHGVIDDIEGLGKLAKRFNVGLHVDCCLGSFIVPFLERAGFNSPHLKPFDFRVEGVSAISCDTHKFGFAPKGSSVIMYRNSSVRKFQYFVFSQWSGGIYASPSVAGSRPGALIAACYSALMFMGEQGYTDTCRKIVGAAQYIKSQVKTIDGIQVCGDPLAMVVAFKSDTLNIYAIGDAMTSKGWNLNTLQHPAAIHICCTLLTVPAKEQFVQDLRDAVQVVRAKSVKGAKDEGNAAIYGMAASIPDKRLVDDIASGYLDVLTKLG